MPKSLANKGFFGQPKSKTLVAQGEMLDLARAFLFHFQGTSPSQEVAVNKSELVDHVRDAAGLDRRAAEAAVNAFISAVMSDVKAGNKVSISGFGIFNPTSRAARTGRNPQTGAPVKIAASKGVRFAPATAFKNELNAGGKKAAAKKAAPAKKASPAKKGAASSAKKAPAKKAAKSTKKR
jgi:DNA-binding protein HU-beta